MYRIYTCIINGNHGDRMIVMIYIYLCDKWILPL